MEVAGKLLLTTLSLLTKKIFLGRIYNALDEHSVDNTGDENFSTTTVCIGYVMIVHSYYIIIRSYQHMLYILSSC